MASSSQQPAEIESGGERNEVGEAAAAVAAASEAGNGSQLVMPEDGYEWKKYGQKFIKNIQKIRSYFRCRNKLCSAKKKVEWHPSDPSGALRIVYDGAHQHGSPPSPSSAAAAGGGGASNRYELGAQYFGGGPAAVTQERLVVDGKKGRRAAAPMNLTCPAPASISPASLSLLPAPPGGHQVEVPVDALRRCNVILSGDD